MVGSNFVQIINLPPFPTNLEIPMSSYNLFVGSNGSGKTRLLTTMYDSVLDNNTEKINYKLNANYKAFIPETRFTRVTNFDTSTEDIAHLSTNFDNYNHEDSPKIKEIQGYLQNLFKRKVVRAVLKDGTQVWAYEKTNGLKIPILQDSLGIRSVIQILEYAVYVEGNSTLFIEDITMCLNPAVAWNFLEILLKLLEKKKCQLFATTQDFVCLLYFLEIQKDWSEKINLLSFIENEQGGCNVDILGNNNLEEFLKKYPFLDALLNFYDYLHKKDSYKTKE